MKTKYNNYNLLPCQDQKTVFLLLYGFLIFPWKIAKGVDYHQLLLYSLLATLQMYLASKYTFKICAMLNNQPTIIVKSWERNPQFGGLSGLPACGWPGCVISLKDY